MTLFFVSVYGQEFGNFLIAVFGLYHYSKRNKAISLLGVYGFVCFLLQLAQFVSTYTHSGLNNHIGNLSILFETLILIFFFFLLINHEVIKKAMLFLMALYFFLFLIVFYQNPGGTFSSIQAIRDVVLIVCSLLYFYSLIKEMPTTDITRYPLFWIVSSILFYFSCTFILSLILDYLITVMNDNLLGYWTYRNFMRFGFCIGITYGLLLDLKETKKGEIFLNA